MQFKFGGLETCISTKSSFNIKNWIITLYSFCTQSSKLRRKGVQNLGFAVQNCTKWVQHYDPVFYVEVAWGGGGWLHVSNFLNFNCGWRKKEGCTKFATWCTKLYKISTKLRSIFLCWNFIWAAACHQPPNLNCGECKKGVQNLGLVYKIMIYFSLSKFVLGYPVTCTWLIVNFRLHAPLLPLPIG